MAWYADLSSSPLRGAATGEVAALPQHIRRSSSPLRGAATLLAAPDGLVRRFVIIAPTRGSNRRSSRLTSAHTQVIIAPTRGSNTSRRTRWPGTPICHHRPYEGQQQEK